MKTDPPATPGKLTDMTGKTAEIPCILCAIREGDPQVANFEITRSKLMIASLNLLPSRE